MNQKFGQKNVPLIIKMILFCYQDFQFDRHQEIKNNTVDSGSLRFQFIC